MLQSRRGREYDIIPQAVETQDRSAFFSPGLVHRLLKRPSRAQDDIVKFLIEAAGIQADFGSGEATAVLR
jgi:hypothetical protein